MEQTKAVRQRIVKRQYDRVKSCHRVECRAGGHQFSAVLANVSVGGCMLEIPRNRLSIADRVNIKVDNGIRTSGIVVWDRNAFVGIKFDSCLHEAVVSFLAFSAKASHLTRNAPSDRFGRTLPRLRADVLP
ncbi:PilZ domain-containing protein [Croceicoccus naphthovorans]|nr:PilZ domain-containing protein [Croceicoccus naphthovorans]MBB3992368.1 hypothetical protein [Croceicoccus naphthovorans]